MNKKGTTKSGGQKHALDKFYTKPEIAKYFIDKCNVASFTRIIEPAAGSGAFSNQIANCIAYDLEPESSGIIKQDWFEYIHEKQKDEKVLVIGNPPFGQQNSLAITFINHSASFSDTVAFILPISFKKDSVQARVDKNFTLVYEEALPKNSFTLDGKDYDVKCIFQIWKKTDTPRIMKLHGDINKNNLFSYVTKSESPDIVIQRVGGNAGKAFLNVKDKSEASNYFVKLNKKAASLDKIVKKLNDIAYESKDYTVGPRSISKKELNQEINKLF
jgi:predicted RNA methylase